MLSQKYLSKQPVILAGRIRLRALYAQVLTADPNVSMRSFTALRKYPLDAIVLRILLAKQQQHPASVNKAILSLLRYVERTPSLRSDRPVWLLSKVLAYYGQPDNSSSVIGESVVGAHAYAGPFALQEQTYRSRVRSESRSACCRCYLPYTPRCHAAYPACRTLQRCLRSRW